MPLPSKEKTPCICQLALCLCLLSRQKLQAWALGWVFGPAIVCMIYIIIGEVHGISNQEQRVEKEHWGECEARNQ